MRVAFVSVLILLLAGCGSASSGDDGGFTCDPSCQDLNTADALVASITFL